MPRSRDRQSHVHYDRAYAELSMVRLGQWMKVAKCISAPCLAKSGEDTLPIWGILLFCSSDIGKMYYWLKVAIYRFSTKRNSWLRVAIFHSIALKLRMPSVTAVPVSNSGKAL